MEKKDLKQQECCKENCKDTLTEQELDKVAGGVSRAGGDDDLDDLEVERLK